MKVSHPITEIKGVGSELAKKFGQFDIQSVSDLIGYFPRRYDDYSELLPIAKLIPGQVSVQAKIEHATGRYVRRGMHITEAIASDGTGSLRLVWFNQPYRAGAIKSGQEYYISGEYALKRARFSITNPSIELVNDFPVNTARIIPIYKEQKGISSHQIRRILKNIFENIPALSETLPPTTIKSNKLISYDAAVREMHFPTSPSHLAEAKRRLGFEEVFRLTLAALLNKYELYQNQAVAVPFNVVLAKDFVGKLIFKLTDAQRKVIWQIYKDIAKTQPMNRLVEGDVGSGKTVVAVMTALMAMEQEFQVALMAPTEILARQHADSIHKLLDPVGFGSQVGLLVGSLSTTQKQIVRGKVKSGELKMIIGTHALIQDSVDMHKLGLVIVDEQHRFGVEQRKKLQAKAGVMPHVLSMTATPIPRSLALTLYGELDISLLDKMPDIRKKVHTKLCSPNSRTQLYKEIDQKLDNGEQLFVVCPLIETSEKLPAYSVEYTFEELSKKAFKHRRVGLLHGKMPAEKKQKTMQDFATGKLDILVATTVIEVGVHVPGATMILIEGAERFGLAQIHQLRGRVGREGKDGYCYLMPSGSQAPSQRLRALVTTSDGFKLAELDLELRGPGAIYGHTQHGLLDLRVAKLSDTKLIASARASAQAFIDSGENLLEYKQLSVQVQKLRAVTNLN